MDDTLSSLRLLPSVSAVLSHPSVQALEAKAGHTLVRDAVRDILSQERSRLASSETTDTRELILDRIIALLPGMVQLRRFAPRKVINATGIVLHTNLGRAPLPRQALDGIVDAAAGYCDIEFDLETGRRGSRQARIGPLLCRMLGSEAAYVTNNNAAAVLLTLDTLARGKEVIVSRGELVEIGGSFRIPEIIESTGASLVEVGTTNRTRISDYEKAIGPDTAVILKVHTSNYSIIGFTESVEVQALAELGARSGLPVVYDIGSGSLVDFREFGLEYEPTAAEAIAQGADLVTMSGDKLLGGPQAGIIAGRAKLVSRISRNPLSRALRIDKLCLAALSESLALYLDRDTALVQVPVVRMLTETRDKLQARADRVMSHFQGESDIAEFSIIDDPTEAGGGSMPATTLPGIAIAIKVRRGSAQEFRTALRMGTPPVVARIAEDAVRVNMRTVFDEDVPDLVAAIHSALVVLERGGRA